MLATSVAVQASFARFAAWGGYQFARTRTHTDTSNKHVKTAQQTQSQNNAAPKHGVVEDPFASYVATSLRGHNGQLQHHGHESVAAQFLRDAAHDQLVAQRADQERERHGNGVAEMNSRGEVDVPSEEVVDWDVPLSTEFQPVGAVPPVGVEVAVGETGYLGERAEEVLPNDEEDEKHGHHEGEEEHGDCLGEDEGFVSQSSGLLQTDSGVGEDGCDEFFRDDGHEEDAAEDGERFPEDLQPANAWCARILELVAECGAEDVVDVVVECQILWEGDLAKRRNELGRKVLPQLGQFRGGRF